MCLDGEVAGRVGHLVHVAIGEDDNSVIFVVNVAFDILGRRERRKLFVFVRVGRRLARVRARRKGRVGRRQVCHTGHAAVVIRTVRGEQV